MSEAFKEEEPVPAQATTPPSDETLVKRPANDEIEFISSNPVKKRRLTEQKSDSIAPGPMAPPPPPQTSVPKQQQTPPSPRIPPTDRRRSLCGIGHVKVPVPGSTLENRGASLPALEDFLFPQSFPPIPNQPSRLSVAISPKQLPQAFPVPHGTNSNTIQPLPPAPSAAPQNSVSLDQISCLDFNGVPTNTPGFDLNQIFSADGGIMGGFGMCNTGAPSLGMGNTPLNPMNTQNAIPFTMYSTGNIMATPQAHSGTQLLPSFPSAPIQSQHQQMPNSQGQYPMNPPQHSQQCQPPGGNLAFGPPPVTKPPCLHCARIRQENLVRRAQGSPLLPTNNVAHQHRPASQQHHNCHPPPAPVNSHLPRPILPPPVLIPRSTPATGQQHQHRHSHHSPAAQSGGSSSSSSSSSMLDTAATRPNLVQDIAQTVQASFPYAQVAARHGLLPAKIAEVVSNMVIGPLLRGAGRV
ncbi:hypothetical protein C8A00DRAFT_36270 [Chaetomidium leptoderma]|uniref:Uncharacterized protein n=1 Tax=Chaetomidium leptoderma TaxID=669021 RepID=A0AAN6ZU78_9PEZI|nr:hypothetical protein C8A00DRAFT_36270 [Chaetomidium leptoderma]